MITMIEDVLLKLNPGLIWQKLRLTTRGTFLLAQMDMELRKKLVKCYIWSIATNRKVTGSISDGVIGILH
jgi:hypothetical protein